MKEEKVEQRLKNGVEEAGGQCVKFVPMYYTGFPDRIVLMPKGRIKFVELKAPGRKPDDVQKRIHNDLRKLGFEVHVLDTIEAVNIFLSCL